MDRSSFSKRHSSSTSPHSGSQSAERRQSGSARITLAAEQLGEFNSAVFGSPAKRKPVVTDRTKEAGPRLDGTYTRTREFANTRRLTLRGNPLGKHHVECSPAFQGLKWMFTGLEILLPTDSWILESRPS